MSIKARIFELVLVCLMVTGLLAAAIMADPSGADTVEVIDSPARDIVRCRRLNSSRGWEHDRA